MKPTHINQMFCSITLLGLSACNVPQFTEDYSYAILDEHFFAGQLTGALMVLILLFSLVFFFVHLGFGLPKKIFIRDGDPLLQDFDALHADFYFTGGAHA